MRWGGVLAAGMAAFTSTQAKASASHSLAADIARQCEVIGTLASAGPATFAQHDLFHGEGSVIKVDLLNDGAPVDVRLGSQGSASIPDLETPDGDPLPGVKDLLDQDGVGRFDTRLGILRVDNRIWTVAFAHDDPTNTVWLEAATDNDAVCHFAPEIVSTGAVLTPGLSPAEATLARDILLHGAKEAKTTAPPLDQDHWEAIAPDFPLIGHGFLTGKAWRVHFAGTTQPQTLSQVALYWGGGPGCDGNLVVWTDSGKLRAFWPIWPVYGEDNPKVGLGRQLSWSTLCNSVATPVSVAPGRTLLLLTREKATSTREGAVLVDITAGVSKDGRVLGHVENKVNNRLTDPR